MVVTDLLSRERPPIVISAPRPLLHLHCHLWTALAAMSMECACFLLRGPYILFYQTTLEPASCNLLGSGM